MGDDGQGNVLIKFINHGKKPGVVEFKSVDEPAPRFGTDPLLDLNLKRLRSIAAGEARQIMFDALPSKASDHSLTGRASRPGSAGTSRLLQVPFLSQSMVVELTSRGLSTDRRLFVAGFAGFGAVFTVHASLTGSVCGCFLYIQTNPSRLGIGAPGSMLSASTVMPIPLQIKACRSSRHHFLENFFVAPIAPASAPIALEGSEGTRRK